MNSQQSTDRWLVSLVALEVVAIAFMLLLALLLQIVLKELPCPLCLLQRVGFLGIAVSLLLNCRHGFSSKYYSLAILFSVFTAFVALRQIALHVVPGTGAYGQAFLGLHLYTWSFIAAMLVIIYSCGLILFAPRLQPHHIRLPHWQKMLVNLVFILLLAVLIFNIIGVYLECGFTQCPDNPIHYLH